jgi:acyl carrier protein
MKWTHDTVRSDLMALLQQHAQHEGEIKAESHLVGDLGIDSLGVMEIVADIEDKFKLSIPDDVLREVETVDDVVKAITKRLESAGRLEG